MAMAVGTRPLPPFLTRPALAPQRQKAPERGLKPITRLSIFACAAIRTPLSEFVDRQASFRETWFVDLRLSPDVN